MPAALLFVFSLFFAHGLSADEIHLIPPGAMWRYYKGTNEPSQPVGAWRLEGFDDSSWRESMSGFSTYAYAPEPGYLSDYGFGYQTVYFRKKFELQNPSSLAELTFRVDYDDGFVAYLNGAEVVRRGVAAGEVNQPLGVATYAAFHPRGLTEEIDLSRFISSLHPGENTFAVQLLGWSTSDYVGAFVPEVLGNFTRGPYLQNTTSNSTQIVFKTLTPTLGFVDLRTNRADAVSIERVPAGTPGTNHVATLSGLQPDSEYLYRIGALFNGREVMSEWRPFHTFKVAGSLSFTVLGDSGWGSVAQHRIAQAMRGTSPNLIMHVGDVVYYAYTHSSEDFRCFSVYAGQLSTTPMFLALGNHENYLDPRAALESFYLPTNNVTGTEHFYSFDHGDAHFTVVWSNLEAYSDYSPGSPQYKWLEQDLAASTKPWKFLFFHHVWRSSGPHGGDDYDLNGVLDSTQLEAGPVTLARKYGVQVIFNGHDHDYERFTPSGGVLSVVTGGGGGILYPPRAMHPDSVQYYNRNQFLKVTVEGEEALIEAIGTEGTVFDRMHIRRSLPERPVYPSSWHSPRIDAFPPSDGDGNSPNEEFDVQGEAIGGKLGLNSSTGRLFVNNDNRFIYIALDEVMLHTGDELLVFLETPGLAGVASLESFSTLSATNSLQTLQNLAFTNFAPSVGVILGDEFGDGGFTQFVRAGARSNTGQGAFYLTNGLPLVAGQRLAQFNRSPQVGTVSYEQNADFIKLALPYSALNLKPGDIIKVGAVVALRNELTNVVEPVRLLDGGIARSLSESHGVTALEGVQIQLEPDRDIDDDGLMDNDELDRGTDPRSADSDGDGLPDGWEVSHGLNPLVPDAEKDLDGDGSSNIEELIAGTDPRNAASRLRLTIGSASPGRLLLQWTAVPGRLYRLQSRNGLSGSFQDLLEPSFPRTARGPIESVSLPIVPGAASEYYRILVVPE